MKSAFALIAVALMIMVAVVPMVSVFSDNGEAAVGDVTVSPIATNKITVSGTVKDTSSQNIDKALVLVTAKVGDDTVAQEYGLTNSSGFYSIAVNLKTHEAVDIDVSVIVDDDTYKAKVDEDAVNPASGREFSAISLTNVTGDMSGVDFLSGKILVYGSVKYTNGVVYETGITVEVYSGETKLGETTSVKGSYSVLIPASSTARTITVKDNSSQFTDVQVTNVKDKSVAVGDLKHKNLYSVTVTGFMDFTGQGVTASVPATSKLTITEASKTYNKGTYSFTYAEVASPTTEQTDRTVKLSDTLGFGIEQTFTFATTDITKSYSNNAYFYGAVTIGTSGKNIPVTGSVYTAVFKDADKQTVTVTGATFVSDKNSYYLPYAKLTLGTSKYVNITATYDGSVTENTGDLSIPTSPVATMKDITLPTTGYQYIKGKVLLGTTGVADITITAAVTGSKKLIGVIDDKLTTTSNGYSFYAPEGETITLTPSAAKATFTPSSQNYVVIGEKTLDFTCTQTEYESTFTIVDAANNALEGMNVYYSFTGAKDSFKSYAVTDDKGKFSFVYDAATGVIPFWIYVVDAKGVYTFDNSATSPVKIESTTITSVMAKEKNLTFQLADADANAIANTGITVTVAKYYVRSSDGTFIYEQTEDFRAVTYKDKVFSFIGDATVLTDVAVTIDGGYRYAASVTVADSSKYTFASQLNVLTADAVKINAQEKTFTGTVTDNSATPVELSGMSVVVLDKDKKAITTAVTTNPNGTFSIIASKADAKYYKVTDAAGVYTFAEATDITAATIKAVEGLTGEYTLKDAAGVAIKDSAITVTAYTKTDGVYTKSGATATVDAEGKFSIIRDATDATYFMVADPSKTYEFADYTTLSGSSIAAKNAVITVTVTANSAAVGTVAVPAVADPIEGAIVEVYQINATTGAETLKYTLITDDKGQASANITKANGFKFVTEYGALKFDDVTKAASTAPANVNVTAKNGYVSVPIGFKYTAETEIVVDLDDYGVYQSKLSGTNYVKVADGVLVTNDDKVYAKVVAPIDGGSFVVDGIFVTVDMVDITNGVEFYYPFSFEPNTAVESNGGSIESVDSNESYAMFSKDGINAFVIDAGAYGAVEDAIVGFYTPAGELIYLGVSNEAGKVIVDTAAFVDAGVAQNKALIDVSDVVTPYGTFTFDETGTVVETMFTRNIDLTDSDLTAADLDALIVYYEYVANGIVVDSGYAVVERSGINTAVYKFISAYGNAVPTVIDAGLIGYTVTVSNDGVIAISGESPAGPVTTVFLDLTAIADGHVSVIGVKEMTEVGGIVAVGTKLTFVADASYIGGDDHELQYVFAGWFVNGVKVSDATVFDYNVVGGDRIAADYTATLIVDEGQNTQIVEKIEQVPTEVVKDSTPIMIIAICGVIVALLAVAFVVLQTRKN